MTYTVRVLGDQRLIETLQRAAIEATDLKALNKEAANTVATVAGNTAPSRTGRLGRSARAGATKKAGVVRVGNNTTVKYANPIEWGWPARNIKPAHFATDAAKATEPLWVRNYNRGIDRILGRIEGV
ncbi:HK97 gp10 family phage protein [Rhodococcus sp. IEGM 1318]|uniref:HK97 gp10 family phage protein n=1 Tax=Rhodococcus sp. IEGM 1318 TaxID=3082226 RepID=UPI002953E675|nr:HK97 gp10 family phage protein [Rhodococcus sp. IEGM 1318]MDV8003856.1 HK97 gp10 family phage protein [Rhodococcus sp. IEGM 1318]